MPPPDIPQTDGHPSDDHDRAVRCTVLQRDREMRLIPSPDIGPRTQAMASDHPIVASALRRAGSKRSNHFSRPCRRINGMAVVVVTHLDPSRESMLAEIIGRATWMLVATARDGKPVEAQHVYVLPPGAILTIQEGRLRLRQTSGIDRERNPIDLFFGSLAEDQGERAIGILLSGGGSDGTLGFKAIKEKGGLTIAQGSNTSRPRFPEMPASAVAAGFVDLLLSVENIPERLVAYARNSEAVDLEPANGALSNVFPLLNRGTGHDFSAYKDTTVQRRVQRRMQIVQAQSLEDYVE